jgi:uncharacterized membrane protein
MASRRAFLQAFDATAVEAAIARAETRTSGEIRVSIAGFFLGSSRRLAERAFQRLGMHATRDRNGVLLLIAPARREVVVLGDEGIHAQVGDAFWTEIATRVGAHFRDGRFTQGVVEAVDAIGEALARYFPAGPQTGANPNELPDTIDLGGRPGLTAGRARRRSPPDR